MLREGLGFSRVIIRVGKTDLRRGIDGLASIIRLEYGLEPMEAGTLFLFCGTKRDRIKGLLYEGDGFLLLIKRLTDGVFQWPRNSNEAMECFLQALFGESCRTKMENIASPFWRVCITPQAGRCSYKHHRDSAFIPAHHLRLYSCSEQYGCQS